MWALTTPGPCPSYLSKCGLFFTSLVGERSFLLVSTLFSERVFLCVIVVLLCIGGVELRILLLYLSELAILYFPGASTVSLAACSFLFLFLSLLAVSPSLLFSVLTSLHPSLPLSQEPLSLTCFFSYSVGSCVGLLSHFSSKLCSLLIIGKSLVFLSGSMKFLWKEFFQ